MKVNSINWRLMNRRLRFGESVKELLCPNAPGCRQRRSIDQLKDFRQGPMRMAILAVRVSVAAPFAVFVRVVVIMTGRITMGMSRQVIVIVIVRMSERLFVLIHGKLCCRHTRTKHTLGGDLASRHRQAAHRAFQVGEWEASVQKGAEDHVTRDTRKAIEIENTCHGPRR
jgi:hypothetical protein